MERVRFYRNRATAQRVAAEAIQLPYARQRYLDAAETWERMADQEDAMVIAKAGSGASHHAELLGKPVAHRRDRPHRRWIG
jgi:hypothetical protein